MIRERDNGPLQAQIKQILRDEIAGGIWPPGSRIPPEPELMRRFSVSRITVSQAMGALASEGLIVRRQGKGTFVASTPQGSLNLGGLLQQMPSDARELEHTQGQMTLTPPPLPIAVDLQLAPGESTWVFTRVKIVKGAPRNLEQAYIPAHLMKAAPNLNPAWEGRFFIEILEDLTGQQARRCRAFLHAIALDPATADTLQEPHGKPALEVSRLWQNETGQPVMLTRSILRPDGTRYYVDLQDLPPKGGTST